MLDDEDEEVDIVGVSKDSAPASGTLLHTYTHSHTRTHTNAHTNVLKCALSTDRPLQRSPLASGGTAFARC